MKLGRYAVAALALSAVMFTAQKAEAANGSNYIHLMNGLDYFFGKTPPAGQLAGIWRCFPQEMLHSPTLVIDPLSPEVGKYATKIVAMHLTCTSSVGTTIDFPVLSLSSAPGTCAFLTSAGTLNYALFSVSGFGTVIGGPLDGGGPGAVNILAGVTGVSVTNPTAGPGFGVQIALNLLGAFPGAASTIAVPDGESLVFFVQDDPNQFGPGTMQYWMGSADELFLCSGVGYSFLLQPGGATVGGLFGYQEYAIGLGSLDATATPVIVSRQSGPGITGITNTHSPSMGFNPGFDQGNGTLRISISGANANRPTLALPPTQTEAIGFAVYDENNQYGGAFRLAYANLIGVLAAPCLSPPTFTPAPPPFAGSAPNGPFAGPVLTAAFPTQPRSVLTFDALTNLVLSNPIWLAATNHSTNPGGLNIPWWVNAPPTPTPVADVSGSNGTGNHGGFMIPLGPPASSAVGLVVGFANFAVDPNNTFLDHGGAAGHSLSNSYQVIFAP